MLEYAALVGIDWADAKHDVCLLDCATGQREPSVIQHTPEELEQWADSLRRRYPGRKVAVCLEQSRGPLIYALLKYDFLILYPVNPKTLAKFREALTPSRAKDDPGDAAYLVDLLALHRDKLRAWLPDDEKTRTLQYLVEHRRRLVGDRTRISNRLTSLLKGYFPQVLDWFPDPRAFNSVMIESQNFAPSFSEAHIRLYTLGFSRFYLLVEDDAAAPPLANANPRNLFDSAHMCYELKRWRHLPVSDTATGEVERGPEKRLDNFGNGLMMCVWDGLPVAAPLGFEEKMKVHDPRLAELEVQAERQGGGLAPEQEFNYFFRRDRAARAVGNTGVMAYDEWGEVGG